MWKTPMSLLLTLSLLAVMAAGCRVGEIPPALDPGPAGDGGIGETAATATADALTLTVWESADGPDEFIRQAGAVFTAMYPNIIIDIVNVGPSDAIVQIALDGPVGGGADIFAAAHEELGGLVADGHIVPVNDSDALTGIMASCIAAATIDGKIWGYPVASATDALFYNRALIGDDDVPATWDDLKAWTILFQDRSPGRYGLFMAVGADGAFPFTTGDGNRPFGADGADGAAPNLNSVAAVKGMQFFASLREGLDVPAADLNDAAVVANFVSGNAAMVIGGPGNVAGFTEQGIDFGVTSLPCLPGETAPAVSFSRVRLLCVSAYGNHPEEAALFAAFLCSEAMQRLRHDLTGAIPAIKMPLSSPVDAGFLRQSEYSFPVPVIPEMARYREALDRAAARIWDGADARAELDAADAAIR